MATPSAAPGPSVPTRAGSRLARARARRRSLLRRRSDRWRDTLLELQVVALLAVTVLCALLGFSVYRQGRAHTLEVRRSLQPTQARVLTTPVVTGVGGDVAEVSWTAPDGSTRQSSVDVPAADRVGDQVQIWLDRNGHVVAGPETTANVVGTAALTGLLSMVAADVVLLSAGALARARLDRHDEAAWDAEWLVYEPRWSQRR